MKEIKAVGFDLFSTLVVMDRFSREDALECLTELLRENGFEFNLPEFIEAYLETVRESREQSLRDEKESHNRYWISNTLHKLGYPVSATDPRIAKTVTGYFANFMANVKLLPGTEAMLHTLQKRYRLGLLSNFTHAPAVREMLARKKLQPFFETILISGDLGYRKPARRAFLKLVDAFDLPPQKIAFVGDNPVDDMEGALRIGIRPVWTTYGIEYRRQLTGAPVKANNTPPPEGVPRITNWEELLTLLGAE